MNSFVLRGLDPKLVSVVKRKAQAQRLSVNKWILRLVRKACGMDKESLFPDHRDLDSLAGTWSAKEAEAFRDAARGFERIDKEMWR